MKNMKNLCGILLVLATLISLTSCNQQRKITQLVQTEWEEADNFENNSFMQVFSDYSNFVFIDMQESTDGCYTLSYEITSPFVLDELKKYQSDITEIPDETQMNAKIIEMIQNATPKTTTQTVTVYTTDDGYQVVFSQGFIDAMYGYCYTYCMEEIHKVLEGN